MNNLFLRHKLSHIRKNDIPTYPYNQSHMTPKCLKNEDSL